MGGTGLYEASRAPRPSTTRSPLRLIGVVITCTSSPDSELPQHVDDAIYNSTACELRLIAPETRTRGRRDATGSCPLPDRSRHIYLKPHAYRIYTPHAWNLTLMRSLEAPSQIYKYIKGRQDEIGPTFSAWSCCYECRRAHNLHTVYEDCLGKPRTVLSDPARWPSYSMRKVCDRSCQLPGFVFWVWHHYIEVASIVILVSARIFNT